MAGGYAGKIAFVDLSRGEILTESLDETLAREYIGGQGLGARILFERQKKGVDPLGPKNILGFTTGPLTGTKTPTGGRYMVVCKSPLTGGWGDANSGGYFGSEIKDEVQNEEGGAELDRQHAGRISIGLRRDAGADEVEQVEHDENNDDGHEDQARGEGPHKSPRFSGTDQVLGANDGRAFGSHDRKNHGRSSVCLSKFPRLHGG